MLVTDGRRNNILHSAFHICCLPKNNKPTETHYLFDILSRIGLNMVMVSGDISSGKRDKDFRKGHSHSSHLQFSRQVITLL